MTSQTTDTQMIGGCRLETLLGEGSVGKVYRALHLGLGRPQAIKVIHEQLAAEGSFPLRFQQLSTRLAELRHPSLVAIFDQGEEQGRPYLAMELLAFGSLRTLLQGPARQALDLAAGLALIAQSVDALAYAHARGLPHRHLKPENLLLQSQDGDQAQGYTLKLGDLGLAQLLDSDEATAETPAASLRYLAPEQCRGQRGDARSDCYALGTILYELVTGSVPFAFDTLDEALAADRSGQRPVSPRRIRPDLPLPLEQLILRCLERDPAARPTAAEVATSLRHAPSPTERVETAAPLAPRIQVLSEQGQKLMSALLGGAGLLVGRLPSCGLRLDNPAVAEQHAQIDWDGRQVLLSGAGTGAELILDAVRLPAQTRLLPWDWRQILQIGPYHLQLERPAVAPLRDDGVIAPYTMLPPPSPRPQEALDIKLLDTETRQLRLIPGKPALARLSVTNIGREVIHPRIEVRGLPPGTKVQQSDIPQLRQQDQAQVSLSITVPERPTSLAQPYSVLLEAYPRSEAQPGEASSAVLGCATATWVVAAFAKGRLLVQPPGTPKVWRRARYRVTVHNDGNEPVSFRLGADALDAEDSCFKPASFTIEPGEQQRTSLTISLPWRWVGKSTLLRFDVRAMPQLEGGPALEAPARLLHRAVLPRWALALLPALLTLLVVLWLWYTNPPAIILQPEPQGTVVAGVPLRVAWTTQPLQEVTLQANGTPEPITPGATGVVINDTVPYATVGAINLELTGSDRWGRVATAVAQVQVVTPAAAVSFQPPLPTALVVGTPLSLFWQATNAPTIELKVNGTLQAITPQSAGFVLEDTTALASTGRLNITLSGSNAFGSVATQSTAITVITVTPVPTLSPTAAPPTATPTVTPTPTATMPTPTPAPPTPAASGYCTPGVSYGIRMSRPERAGQVVELLVVDKDKGDKIVGNGIFDAAGQLQAQFTLPLGLSGTLQLISVRSFDKVILGQLACLVPLPTLTPRSTSTTVPPPKPLPTSNMRLTPIGTPQKEFGADPTGTPRPTVTSTRTP